MLKYLIILMLICNLAFAGDTQTQQGAWLLNEASGTRVDETANNNDLTDNNTVLSATGQFGDAGDFELTNSEYLSIADASQTGLDITSNLSIVAWVKRESTGTLHSVVSKYDATDNQASYYLQVRSTNVVRCIVDDDGNIGAGLAIADGTTTISAATWFHIACVFNDTANTVKVYVDAVEEGSVAFTTSIFNSDTPFMIGAVESSTTPTLFFDGLIDEVSVFSSVLDTSELTDLKDRGLEVWRKRRVVS